MHRPSGGHGEGGSLHLGVQHLGVQIQQGQVRALCRCGTGWLEVVLCKIWETKNQAVVFFGRSEEIWEQVDLTNISCPTFQLCQASSFQFVFLAEAVGKSPMATGWHWGSKSSIMDEKMMKFILVKLRKDFCSSRFFSPTKLGASQNFPI